jgi:hypothetical protein
MTLRIITSNGVDEATLAASPSGVSSLPVEHLQEVARSRVFRTDGLPSTQTITGTWSLARVTSGLCLWRHNLSSEASLRVRLWDGANQSGNLVYDSGTVNALPPKSIGDLRLGIDPLGANLFTEWEIAYSTVWWSEVAAQSFQLDVSDGSNSDGYLEAARLYLGLALAPTSNFERGWSVRWADPSEQTRTAGGTVRTLAREPYRVLELDLELLSAADRSRWFDMQRSVGKRKDVFVSAFPEEGGGKERDHAFAAKFPETGDMTGPIANYYATSLVLQET